MTHTYFSQFIRRYGYVGRLLHQAGGSMQLKRQLSKWIALLAAMEKVSTPVIPYIAAWRLNGSDIWYEYAGQRLPQLLGCDGTDLARTVRDNLVSRCLYRKQVAEPRVEKIVRSSSEIERVRHHLRRLAERGGNSEAVYKVEAPTGAIWLKDLARIEVYEQENLVLSIGSLIEVTKEMELEEELHTARQLLENQRQNLADLVEERTRELRQSQLEVVSRLTQAANCRDDHTGAHGKRLSQYCAVLGKSCGLSKKANWLLYHAVPMHDVGKLGIADSVLLKNGPLSAEEFSIIKGHCHKGAELLSGASSKLLQVARVIALTHHERWDGSGYPQGLQGGKIPLAGRLAAICDVFDALTSDRPYKVAWEFDEAVDEIQRLKGVYFDPQLVDHFSRNTPAMRRVFTAHQQQGCVL